MLVVLIVLSCLLLASKASFAPTQTSPVSASLFMKSEAEKKALQPILLRGGGDGGSSAAGSPGKKTTVRKMIAKRALGLWGVLQVVSIIGNAIKRVLPIAMQPFQQDDLKPLEWAMYVAWSFYMIYMEGYKAFQCKFSPLVVKRAFKLVDRASPLNVVLAGPYSMGMLDASKKRMMVSWGVTVGVFGIVQVVKKLPYPYRSIVDAGVVAGLSYGTAATLWFAGKALCGFSVDCDPEFPAADADDGKKSN